MDSRKSLRNRALVVMIVLPILCLFCGAEAASAQDSTVFADDFQSYPVQTFARGCGDMTADNWRWSSHHYYACYSAGWGVEYGQLSANTTNADKNLSLWGGIPWGGGGDCAAALEGQEYQELTDYTITAVVSPVKVVNTTGACRNGMITLAGRVQGTATACTGYHLALSLNNGEDICGDGSYLELYSNERGGPYCSGRDPMRLLASVEVDISADLGGNFPTGQEYVMKLCFSGEDIFGGVWTAEGWQGGMGVPLAEVNATDATYASGTAGLYQGASRTNFDDIVVTVGSDCLVAQPTAMEAELDFDPNTLNTRSKGRYITCYIELPPDYDPAEIDVATLMLNDVVPAESKPTEIGDNDDDGVDDLMVKFDRAAVIDVLTGAFAPSAMGDPSAGATSGGGEFSWNSTGDNTGISGGGEFTLGGLPSGSRYSVAADAGGTSGGAEFSWGADPGGTSGGAEFSMGGAADHGDTVEVWVSGQLLDGTAFVGRDTIRVTTPGNGSGSGSGSGSGTVTGPAGVTGSPAALTVTPSPVKGRARVGFEVVVAGHVRLSVFDAAGRMVRTLVSGDRGVGSYDVVWDRTTNDGRRVGPGVYFVRLDQPGNTSNQKMMVVQ